jgi:4-hydroxy-tetrahydrodipicolinate synthase
MSSFTGIYPAIVTPFGDDDAIDLDTFKRHADWLLEGGVHGFVVGGTMGEGHALSLDERATLVETLRELAGPTTGIVVGVAASSARDALATIAAAAATSADGVMVLPPVTYAATEPELEAFFAEVAGGSPLPIVVYNNPAVARSDLSPSLLGRIAAHERIVAVKEASEDVRRVAEGLCASDYSLDVIVGVDNWAMEGFAAGASGWISGCANAAPRPCVELFEAVRDGDLARARVINRALLPLMDFDVSPQLVQLYKACGLRLGVSTLRCRAPRIGLAQDAPELAEIDAALRTVAQLG